MPDFMYTLAQLKIANGEIDLDTDDIRALIVMSLTSAQTQDGVEFLASFTTLDEYDGAGYARQALTGKVASANTVTKRMHFTSDNLVFAALAAGTREGFAIIFYKHVGADAVNIPILYKMPSGFPFLGNGENVTVAPHANGWVYSRNGAP